MRNTLDVSIRIDELKCYDEGDGPGDAEPYLWACFYKIDGSTFHINKSGFLTGSAVIQRMTGNQGNLYNTDVSAGDTVTVPPTVGFWHTQLMPIPIHPSWASIVKTAKGWDDIPGYIGVLYVLMEEDNLPNSAALAGYSSFCSTFELRLNETLNTIGVFNPEITPDLETGIRNAVTESTRQAIMDSLNIAEKLWQWLAGPDQTIGSGAFRVSHDKLVNLGTIPFSDRWRNGTNISAPDELILKGPGRFITNGGEWEVKGHIGASEIILHNYEVTCAKSSRYTGKHFRINKLGVRDEHGNVSIFTKGEVMQRIQQGHQFFLIGASGRKSRVIIHEPTGSESINYRFLTTSPDGDPNNNLENLPRCI